jgi:hypothetical protein
MYAITLILVVLLSVYASYENYFRNSSNGKATMRDEVQSNKVREIASKVGRSVKEKIGYLIKNKPIQKAIRSLLEKAGLSKRVLHQIESYKKK